MSQTTNAAATAMRKPAWTVMPRSAGMASARSERRGSHASTGNCSVIWNPPSVHGPNTQYWIQANAMLLSISVAMISLTPNRERRKPGMRPHAAPPRNPATSITARMMTPGVPTGTSGTRTTALAAHAPRRSCPSAPMFQSRMRKASAQARPVRISGVDLTSVSEIAPMLPSDESTMWR